MEAPTGNFHQQMEANGRPREISFLESKLKILNLMDINTEGKWTAVIVRGARKYKKLNFSSDFLINHKDTKNLCVFVVFSVHPSLGSYI
jgi:hypothetical protein